MLKKLHNRLCENWCEHDWEVIRKESEIINGEYIYYSSIMDKKCKKCGNRYTREW